MQTMPGFSAEASLGRNVLRSIGTHGDGEIRGGIVPAMIGHDGRAFCRLNCVVEYTDCYYTKQTPDGVKECRRRRDFCYLICDIKHLPMPGGIY